MEREISMLYYAATVKIFLLSHKSRAESQSKD